MQVFETGKMLSLTVSNIGNVLLEYNKRSISAEQAINSITKIMLDFNAKTDHLRLDVNTSGWEDSNIQCKNCGEQSILSVSPEFELKNYPPCKCGSTDYRKLKVVPEPPQPKEQE